MSLLSSYHTEIYQNNHLELDLTSKFLRTTPSCIPQLTYIANLEAPIYFAPVQPKTFQNKEINQKSIKNQPRIVKKSACFTKELSKVLKKIKISNYAKHTEPNLTALNQTFLNLDDNLNLAHFTERPFLKCSKMKNPIKRKAKEKQKMNLEQALQKIMQKNKAENKEKLAKRNGQKSQRKTHVKYKTLNFQRHLESNVSFLKRNLLTEDNLLQSTFRPDFGHQELKIKSNQTFQQMRISQISQNSLSKNRPCEKIEQNKSFRTQKSLHNSIAENQEEDKNKQSEKITNFHLVKLKQQVMNRMSRIDTHHKKRQSKENIVKKIGKESFLIDPKIIKNIVSNNSKIDSKLKSNSSKSIRNHTRFSRVGLQYDKRQTQKLNSNGKKIKQRSITTGKTPHGQHYSISQIEQTIESNSNKPAIKSNLRFYSKFKKGRLHLHTTSDSYLTKVPRQCQIYSHDLFQPSKNSKQFQKQLYKWKTKEKLLGLIYDCQKVKEQHEKLKQGLHVFEDYCDNLGEGLKTITSKINNFLRED